MSYATIGALLDDGMGCSLSGGMLAKVIQKVSQALALPYEEMVQALPQQKTLNIDETSHPENGKRLWNWVFQTPDFTCFTIEASRGAQVLEDLLGTECEATLGSDYYSSYRAFMNKAPVTVQFCLAHLIREARFIAQSSTKVIANYGQRVLDGLKALFKLIHPAIPPSLHGPVRGGSFPVRELHVGNVDTGPKLRSAVDLSEGLVQPWALPGVPERLRLPLAGARQSRYNLA